MYMCVLPLSRPRASYQGSRPRVCCFCEESSCSSTCAGTMGTNGMPYGLQARDAVRDRSFRRR